MKNCLLYLAIFACILIAAQSILTDPYHALIEKVRNSQDIVTMAMITRKTNCARCQLGNDIFNEFEKQYQGQIQFFLIECENYSIDKQTMEKLAMICELSNQQLLPHVTFFAPQLYDVTSSSEKPLPKDSIYQGVVDIDHLQSYAYNLYPITYQEIDNHRELRVFLDDRHILYKVLYIDDIETVPFLIKSVSCQYRDRINFGLIDRDNKALLNKFLVKKFPTLIAFAWDDSGKQYIEHQFDLDFTYQNLTEFLDKILNQESMPKKINIDAYQEQNQVFAINQDELLNLIKNKEYWLLVEIIKGTQHPKLKSVQNYFGDFFKYLKLDCQEADCQVFVSSHLKLLTFPQMIIYPIGTKDIEQFITFQSNDTMEGLANTFLKHIKGSEKVVGDNKEALTNLINLELDSSKYPIVWFHKSTDQLSTLFIQTFNIMSRYSRFFKFMRFPDPVKANQSTWNIPSTLPHIIYYKEYEDQNYTSGVIKSDKSKSFFECIKQFDKLLTEKEQQMKNSKPVEEAKTIEIFEEKCQKGTPCVIAFLDVARDQKFKQDLERFQKLRDNFISKKYNWVWIDGYCHKELLKGLGLSEKQLSHLVYYEAKKQKFKVMKEKYNFKNMISFVEQLKNKKGLLSLDEDLDMEENNCEFIKNEVKYHIEKERQRKKEEKEQQEQSKQKQKVKDDM